MGTDTTRTRVLPFLLAAMLVTATGTAAHRSLIFKVRNLDQISLETLIGELRVARVVTIGEQHDDRSHHEAQLAVIRGLHEADARIAVGFEMFGADSQAELDGWTAGRSGIEDLFRVFSRDWELNWWPLYRPIFLYAREHGIPMVGLNVPREIVRQVAREGFSSLTAEQRGKIRVLSCSIDQRYQETLAAVLGAKGEGGMSSPVFNRFCEAQVVWDTAMALNAVDYINANPDTTLVILAGNFHSWKRGIPEQIRRVADVQVRSILPSSDSSFFNYELFLEDADYVWWMQ